MIFGNTKQFAIEAMVEPDLVPPSSVWGRLRIWCNDFPLGDFENTHCGLPANHLREFAAQVQDLWHPSFAGLDDATQFHHLDWLLFGCIGGESAFDTRSLEECETDANTFSRFSFLTNWGEMFDSTGKCFVVCLDEKTVTVLHRPLLTMDCISFTFPIDGVKTACAQFDAWFSTESARLRPSV